MRRHKVIITIEAETVQTLRELRALESMRFRVDGCAPTELTNDTRNEVACKPFVCGTITQVQVNAIKPAKASAKSKPPRR